MVSTLITSIMRPVISVASLSAVYRSGFGDMLISEKFKPRPITHYAASKLARCSGCCLEDPISKGNNIIWQFKLNLKLCRLVTNPNNQALELACFFQRSNCNKSLPKTNIEELECVS
jgi:hypothetical protein